jgi:cyclopropane-fatty-acyl-phospholipid synthase
MANKQDIDFTYTTLDKIFRLSIGERADFSGAMYRGDFSMSLEEAQRRKGPGCWKWDRDGDLFFIMQEI